MKRILRTADILSLILVGWMGLAFVPVNWVWFDPGDVFISDGSRDRVPEITFDRVIKRKVEMTYQVVIRSLDGNTVVCDPKNGPFPYRPDAKLPEHPDLVWWTGGDERCWPREPGSYIADTCWTVVRPFWGLVPPKTICRRSNVFTVRSISPEDAERVMERQQQIEQTVEGIQRDLRSLEDN
ncbi:conserved hypothetical protein [Ruegeria lacuscaerulensis ITI-1157]|nr:conserved hypothetical protein [Ruegeria lacuscaerulensis ITI-1157]SHK06202.1 hypothetical protein SAMN05444404_3217 [Ruegeria lacuscaerulensis ITI-1157]